LTHVGLAIVLVAENNCTGTGQGRTTEMLRPLESWPNDRDVETFEDFAERPKGRDLRRVGRTTELARPLESLPNDRDVETFGVFAERQRCRDLWSLGRTTGYLADGRTPFQLTLKPRSVKLIHHQELGNATLSGTHLNKQAQQGRPTRIV